MNPSSSVVRGIAIALYFLVPCFPARADFSYDGLHKLIVENQITRIEDLLPKIPDDYKKFYTFVYDSRSSQKENVSTDWPRIIFYGPDARFLMALTKNPNPDSSTNNDDTLETIQYDDANRNFTFRILDFHAGTNPLQNEPQVNPGVCLTCHGTDPRPNWDSYNIWPGVFGSLSRLDCDTMQPGTNEMGFYMKFMAKNRNEDRYQFIPAELANAQGCPQDPKVELNFRNAAVSDPNADLTQKIFDLNQLRIRRLVESSPKYSQFKYAFTGAGKGCFSNDEIEGYFPANYAAQNHVKAFNDVLTDVVSHAQTDFGNQLARFSVNNRGSAVEPQRVPINFMDPADPLGSTFNHRYEVTTLILLLTRMGISPERMSTDFTDGIYDFTNPHSGPASIIMQWGQSPPDDLKTLTCDQLKAASLKALSGKI